MDHRGVKVEMVGEQLLEPLIIIEEGDLAEDTATGGPESMTEKHSGDEDDRHKDGRLEKKTIGVGEERGENGKENIEAEPALEETDKPKRKTVMEEEENGALGEDGTQHQGDETEDKKKVDEKKTREGDEGRDGIEMKVKKEDRDRDLELDLATPTRVLDANGLLSPDRVTRDTLSLLDADKKARRFSSDFPDALYELLCTLQEGRRINDQRCSFQMEREGRRRRCHSEPSITVPTPRVIFSSMTSLQREEFFELVAKSQARRLDDQRAALLKPPKPRANRLRNSIRSMSMVRRPAAPAAPVPVPKEDLYNMILTSQAQGRLEEQRSAAPGPMDDEDFFSLLLRVQGGRMEEQRMEMPLPRAVHT